MRQSKTNERTKEKREKIKKEKKKKTKQNKNMIPLFVFIIPIIRHNYSAHDAYNDMLWP